jgi:hypothetical protein
MEWYAMTKPTKTQIDDAGYIIAKLRGEKISAADIAKAALLAAAGTANLTAAAKEVFDADVIEARYEVVKMIKAKERERCAELFDGEPRQILSTRAAAAIRALKDKP